MLLSSLFDDPQSGLVAVEAGKCVGWDWDIKTGRDRWFGDLQTMFGIQSDTYSGLVEDFRRRIYPEDRELVWKAVADARQQPETLRRRIPGRAP